jgi:hypothetical protein
VNTKSAAKAFARYNEAVKQCQQAEAEFRATLRQVESQLRTEVTHMLALYAANKKLPQAEVSAYLDQVCSLGSAFQFALPPYRQLPDINIQTSRLHAANDVAFNTLAQLFENDTP